MRGQVEFWYEFASSYSYPAAMRIARIADDAQVSVRWRPFLLGPIFAAQGWNDSPFNIYPAKGRYMWRDLARICDRERLPLSLPPVRFPQNALSAARVALALFVESESHVAEFTRRVYRANFAERKDISDRERVLKPILTDLGVRAEQLLTMAESPEIKKGLRKQTDEAATRSIFGAPSFLVAGELFWGNDRLEEAVDLARQSM